jgi:hypothetical protein
VECPPPPHDEEARTANEGFVALSDGLIPPLEQLKLLSIGSGHTNAFLRAVKAGCRSAVPKLANAAGKLDLEALSVGRASFRDAVEKGLRWFVLHWQVPMVWPDLVHFVQSALNTVARNEQSEVEVMLDIQEMVRASLRAGKDPDWVAIQTSATFSMPPCSPYISTIVEFVKNFAGGDGYLLNELASFQKAFACSDSGATRKLGAEYLGKVAAMKFGIGEQFPFVVNACIEANLISPSNKVIDGICKLISPSNLNTVTNKAARSEVKLAEKLMGDARRLLDRMDLDAGSRTRLVGRCDCRCILTILKKSGEVEKTVFKNIDDVAAAFMADLKRVTGQSVSLGDIKDMPGCSSGVTPLVPVFHQETVDELQSKVFQARKSGFVVGGLINKKAATEVNVYRIIDMGEESSKIRSVGDDGWCTDITLCTDTLITEYRAHKGKVTEVLKGWRDTLPLQSDTWALEATKGIIAEALQTKFSEHIHELDSIEINQNPTAVRMVADVKANHLHLVAASQRVDTKAAMGIWVGDFKVPSKGDVGFYVHPHFVAPFGKNGEPNSSPFVSPFWSVKVVQDEEDANVVLKWMAVKLGSGTVEVPFITNTKKLKVGDDLAVCLTFPAKPVQHIKAAKKPRPS